METGERFNQWEHEKTAKRKGGKVFITVSHRGEVECYEGYLPRKQARQIVRDSLEGRNGRTKVENWVPRWMAFPFTGYGDGACGIAERAAFAHRLLGGA